MRAARRTVVLIVSLGLLAFAGVASAAGPGGWDHLGVGATPSLSALNGRVDSLFTASSTALYAGGVFTSAGGDPAGTMIARWDGAGWHPIGPIAISTATGASVEAIAYDSVSGKLFVGGNFINAGGTAAADFVAYWNGFSWQPPCNFSPPGNVSALQIIDRTLYVGGSFAAPTGLPTGQYLIACDIDSGVTTSTVDTAGDVSGAVYALTADASGTLYAAGQFINMDGQPDADHVAAYSGGSWHAMGSGPSLGGGAVDDYVRSITSDGTNVYIGTDSVNVAGIANADHVAKWDGSAWSALGSNAAGTNGFFPATTFINALTTSNGNVFAGGSFQNADGQATADEIARFNGTNWSPIGSDGAGNGPLPGPVNALAMLGSKLIAGGNFTTSGGDGLGGYIASNRVFNQPPTSAILDNTVKRMNLLYLLSLATDSDGTIVSWDWSWGDGSPDAVQDGPRGPFASHQYAAPGTYAVTLTVTDNDGATASSTSAILVRTGPIPAFTVSPPAPVVGQDVTFTSHSTDPDGAIDTNHWTFSPLTPGPGELPFATVSSSPTAVHAFTRAGTYQVHLDVWECPCANATAASVDQNIMIAAAPIPTITKAAVSNAKFRVGPTATAVTARAPLGTNIKFTLKAPATMTIAIARSAPGVRRGKSCVAAPARLKKGTRKCTRAIKAGTLTRKNLQPGANAVAFTGRIGRKALTPGAYTATLTASNAKGKAKPITVRFTIVR